MRLLFIIGMCLTLNACSNCNSYNRGYVISQVHDAAAPVEEAVDEDVIEEPAE